jgi:hypothetical protein
MLAAYHSSTSRRFIRDSHVLLVPSMEVMIMGFFDFLHAS